MAACSRRSVTSFDQSLDDSPILQYLVMAVLVTDCRSCLLKSRPSGKWPGITGLQRKQPIVWLRGKRFPVSKSEEPGSFGAVRSMRGSATNGEGGKGGA